MSDFFEKEDIVAPPPMENIDLKPIRILPELEPVGPPPEEDPQEWRDEPMSAEEAGTYQGKGEQLPPRAFFGHIRKEEGFRPKPYTDPKVDPDKRGPKAIGHGHAISERSRPIFERLVPEVDFDELLAGRAEIDEEQADRIMEHDISLRLEQIRKKVVNFDLYPEYLQIALFGSWFRNGLPHYPNTLRLLNEGKYHEAAVEFLDSNEYRKAKKSGSGVAGRMERYSEAIKRYANELDQLGL